MKFPSLTRMPKYKRFNFEPRYYDPIKEDVKNRTERIRGQLVDENRQSYRENIRNAFNRRERRETRSSMMQYLLIIIFLGTIVGWLYFGNIALYIFAVIFPLYIFLRTRNYFQS